MIAYSFNSFKFSNWAIISTDNRMLQKVRFQPLEIDLSSLELASQPSKTLLPILFELRRYIPDKCSQMISIVPWLLFSKQIFDYLMQIHLSSQFCFPR